MKELEKIFSQLTTKEKNTVNFFLKELSHLSDYNVEETAKTTIEEVEFYTKKEEPRKKSADSYINAFKYCQDKMKETDNQLNSQIVIVTHQLYKLSDEKNENNYFRSYQVNIRNFPVKLVKADQINNHLANFITNFNHTFSKVDLLAKSFLLHHYFEIIHPFPNGNGRLGRLLMIIFWQKHHLWPRKIASLFSYVIREKKKGYLAGLEILSEQLIKKEKNDQLIEWNGEFDYQQFLQENKLKIKQYLAIMKTLYQQAINITFQFIKDFQTSKINCEKKLLTLKKTFRLLQKKPNLITKITNYTFEKISLSYKELAKTLKIDIRSLKNIIDATKLFKDVDSFQIQPGRPEKKFALKKIYRYFEKAN